jgi:hypothetical protein
LLFSTLIFSVVLRPHMYVVLLLDLSCCSSPWSVLVFSILISPVVLTLI